MPPKHTEPIGNKTQKANQGRVCQCAMQQHFAQARAPPGTLVQHLSGKHGPPPQNSPHARQRCQQFESRRIPAHPRWRCRPATSHRRSRIRCTAPAGSSSKLVAQSPHLHLRQLLVVAAMAAGSSIAGLRLQHHRTPLQGHGPRRLQQPSGFGCSSHRERRRSPLQHCAPPPPHPHPPGRSFGNLEQWWMQLRKNDGRFVVLTGGEDGERDREEEGIARAKQRKKRSACG